MDNIFQSINNRNFTAFKKAIRTLTQEDVPPNVQYHVMYMIIINIDKCLIWITEWFSVVPTQYTQSEILNCNNAPDGVLLNYIIEHGSYENVKQAVKLGCDPFLNGDGTPPIFSMYDWYPDKLNDLVFDNMTVNPNTLNNCKLESGESLLHIAATRKDVDIITYLVKTLNMNPDVLYFDQNINNHICVYDNLMNGLDDDDVLGISAWWFSDIGGDVNLLLLYNGDLVSLFYKYCWYDEDLMAVAMINTLRVDFTAGSKNPIIPATVLNHYTLVEYLIKNGIELNYYDEYGNSGIFYMLDYYTEEYAPLFMNFFSNNFLRTHRPSLSNNRDILHTVAASSGQFDLFKYLIEEENIMPDNRDSETGMDILQTTIMNVALVYGAPAKLDGMIQIINYLSQKYIKPDIYNIGVQHINVSAIELLLMVLLHLTHRVSLTFVDLPPISDDLDEDQFNLSVVFDHHDMLPADTDSERDENKDRVKDAMEYTYTVLPNLENQLSLIRKQVTSVDKQYLHRQKQQIYNITVKLIPLCRHINPVFSTFFNPRSKIFSLLKKGQTLKALSELALQQ
ncbi:hypothetical protein SDDV_ORF129 [Scale drop disease virus]|nr:hypothetical protein SDDV_ORF129 [Scale drop disease virus]